MDNTLGKLAARWVQPYNMQPDPVTLQRIEDIHPKLRAELRQIYAEICQVLGGKLGCRFVQVFRTFAEQDALYAQGRNGDHRQVVTNAPGGHSYHNYGLAVDFVLLYDKNQDGKVQTDEIVWNEGTDLDNDKILDWLEVVKVFLKYGWKWGKAWGDKPHFEKSFGYSIASLLAKYQAKQFIPGTHYLNI